MHVLLKTGPHALDTIFTYAIQVFCVIEEQGRCNISFFCFLNCNTM